MKSKKETEFILVITSLTHCSMLNNTTLATSLKATVDNMRNRVEQLFLKESPEEAHSVLSCRAPKDSVSIQGTYCGKNFSSRPLGFSTVAQTITILRPS